MARAIESDVIIVGGGLAGLACGVALADRGVAVTLLEASERLGGRAASWTHAPTGDRVDIGPHVLVNEYDNFLAFLERLGTRGDVTWQPEKVVTVGTRAGPLAITHRGLPPPLSLLPDFLKAPELKLRDYWSNNRATLRAMQFGEERVEALDATTGLEFLRALGVSEPMIDVFWRFETMAIMNTPLERVSAASMMRVHGMLIGRPGIHFGFPAVGLGDLFAEPARRAIAAITGKVMLQARAAALRSTNDAHEVDAGGATYRARHCVLAIPPAETGELAPGIAETAFFEPSPYVSTYLWLDRRLGEEKFWSLLWSPTRLYYDFYDLSNIRPAWKGRNAVVACNLIYSHRANALSDEELVEAAHRELAEFVPAALGAQVLHAEVHRIPMGIPLPAAGTETRRPTQRTHVPGLLLAGDWTHTGWPSCMEGAVRSGHLAAEAVLANLGRPEKLARPLRESAGLAAIVRAIAAARASGASKGSSRSRP